MEHRGLEQIVAELEQEATRLDQAESAAWEQVLSLRNEQRKLRKAIDLLKGAEPPKKRRQPSSQDVQRPRDATMERVLQALIEVGEPMTGTALTPHLDGVGKDTVRRALIYLRQDGRIRVAGTTTGGGKQYAPMPEEADPDATLTPEQFLVTNAP